MYDYTFKKQYETIVCKTRQKTDDDAWNAFWNECGYPEHARDKQKCEKAGIHFDKTPS